MSNILSELRETIYDHCGFTIADFAEEPESKAYNACRFKLDGRRVVSREAKATPKKMGLFVTFWKRSANGPIEPFAESDPIDFFVVNVKTENRLGHFVFPKSVLINHGIVSTKTKEGKRAFRVYPSWSVVDNKQAQRSQKWQLKCFSIIDSHTNWNHLKECYKG